MMFFWIRELVGWGLLAAALYLISIAVQMVGDRQVMEGSVVVFASLIVMRAAILLIRMNTVARISQQSNRANSSAQ